VLPEYSEPHKSDITNVELVDTNSFDRSEEELKPGDSTADGVLLGIGLVIPLNEMEDMEEVLDNLKGDGLAPRLTLVFVLFILSLIANYFTEKNVKNETVFGA